MKFQIGKSGITSGILESLDLAFKTHKVVRISVLKNSVREREKIGDIASELAEKLEGKFNWKVIGFTINLRKLGPKSKR